MDPHDWNRPPVNKPSAPPVPRELLSARPAMTKVVPQSPGSMHPSQVPQPPTAPRLLTPAEEAERQKRLEYIRNLRAQETGHGKKKKLWPIIIVLLLLLVAGGVGYAFWKINQSPKTPTTADSASNATDTPANTQTQTQTQTPGPVTMKDYDSTNFGVSLKYPSDWTLNDTANALTIYSPMVKLPGADGKEKAGAVLVQIRHKQSSLAEYRNGNAVAVLDSKNVAYTSPAEGQRGTTFLSYLQYSTTTTKGALDSIYVTGNSGYKKTQAVPQADIVKVDPLVNVGFIECQSTCATSSPATQVNAEKWVATDTNATVENILKSLAFN